MRRLRRAQFHWQSVDGLELDDMTAKHDGATACATIATSSQIIVTAGRGMWHCADVRCAGSVASGARGNGFCVFGIGCDGEVETTYATDTQGFHMDDV